MFTLLFGPTASTLAAQESISRTITFHNQSYTTLHASLSTHPTPHLHHYLKTNWNVSTTANKDQTVSVLSFLEHRKATADRLDVLNCILNDLTQAKKTYETPVWTPDKLVVTESKVLAEHNKEFTIYRGVVTSLLDRAEKVEGVGSRKVRVAMDGVVGEVKDVLRRLEGVETEAIEKAEHPNDDEGGDERGVEDRTTVAVDQPPKQIEIHYESIEEVDIHQDDPEAWEPYPPITEQSSKRRTPPGSDEEDDDLSNNGDAEGRSEKRVRV